MIIILYDDDNTDISTIIILSTHQKHPDHITFNFYVTCDIVEKGRGRRSWDQRRTKKNRKNPPGECRSNNKNPNWKLKLQQIASPTKAMQNAANADNTARSSTQLPLSPNHYHYHHIDPPNHYVIC